MNLAFLLADLTPLYAEPTFIGGAVAVLAVAGYLLLRRRTPTPTQPEKQPEAAQEPQLPKERRHLELGKASVNAPKEKPTELTSKFGGKVDEAALKAEGEARKAEEEALRLSSDSKRKEEAARKAEEEVEESAAKLAEARRRTESQPTKPAPEGQPTEVSGAETRPQAQPGLEGKLLQEAEFLLQEKRRVAEETKKLAEEAKLAEIAARQKAQTARGLAKKEQERAKSVSEGMTKTREAGFIAKLTELFRGKKQLEQSLLDQVEEILFTADIGSATAQKLLDAAQKELSRQDLADPQAVFSALRQKSLELLSLQGGAFDLTRAKGDPFVIMVIGVNGVGKTTTIGKLASRFVADDKTVILAAGDTFRAAATEQLEIWGERTACEVVRGKEGSDPSAVIFNAIKRAREVGADVVLADTAGRLHTKSNLMEELKKVKRVANKALEGAPHEVILVLDATMGQNAIAQAKQFTSQLEEVSGIVLTKLDGTAKGGVVLGICDDLKIPVRFIGIGEKVGDLRLFDPLEFVDALFAKPNKA